MEISEIMTSNPESVQANESVRIALAKLAEYDIRHLPVLRGKELVGIVSDRDFKGVTSLSATDSYEALLEKPVSGFMSTGVVSVNASDDVSDLLDILIEGKFGATPVIDGHDGRMVGIVSYIDVLKAMRTVL